MPVIDAYAACDLSSIEYEADLADDYYYWLRFSRPIGKQYALLNFTELLFDTFGQRQQHILLAQHTTTSSRKSKHINVKHNATHHRTGYGFSSNPCQLQQLRFLTIECTPVRNRPSTTHVRLAVHHCKNSRDICRACCLRKSASSSLLRLPVTIS